MKLELNFTPDDVTDLLQAADAISDNWHSSYLRILAADVQQALEAELRKEPTMTLPGPDGEPNEAVPARDFYNLTRSWDVV